MDFQVYLDAEDFYFEGSLRTVTFYPYRSSSGKGTVGPKEVRGFIVVPDSLDVMIMGETAIKKVKDSSEIVLRHALVYDYFDYA